MNRLREIFEHKHTEVAAAKLAIPQLELEAIVKDMPPPRGFLASLLTRQPEVGLIAEIKAASPSQGPIRPRLDPTELALIYASAGADCLSVLTDAKYFGGSRDNLVRAREACSLPILRKDFLDDEYQIFEARAWGADAVLLIVAWLTDDQLTHLFNLAGQLGLDALVEVHNEQELERTIEVGANLIGINNRDLSTFRTSLDVTRRLASKVPEGTYVVSESALDINAKVRFVRDCGAHGVLIGTAFCEAADVAGRVKSIMGR